MFHLNIVFYKYLIFAFLQDFFLILFLILVFFLPAFFFFTVVLISICFLAVKCNIGVTFHVWFFRRLKFFCNSFLFKLMMSYC